MDYKHTEDVKYGFVESNMSKWKSCIPMHFLMVYEDDVSLTMSILGEMNWS